MFLTTINGEKLTIKCNTQDQKIIKEELSKKYGYDLDKLHLHWNGNRFIVGFVNEEITKNKINDIIYQQNNHKDDYTPEIDLEYYKDKLINNFNLSPEDKSVICKNLKAILERVLITEGINLDKL